MKPLLGVILVLLACAVVTGTIVYCMVQYFIAGKHITINTRRVDCTRCTAGIQTLYDGDWGPIPTHLRIVQEDVDTFEPPRANSRKCSSCMGRGWYPNDDPYQED